MHPILGNAKRRSGLATPKLWFGAHPVWCQKNIHMNGRACSIDADLGCDAVAHRFEAACIPKKGRAPARHALPILCTGRSEALPLAVFSSRTSLSGIGGATHASRGAHTPGRRALAARASATRRVAKFGGSSRQVRESVTQMRAWTRLRRACRFLDDSANRSGFAMGTPEQGKEDRRRPTRRQRFHIDTLASLVARKIAASRAVQHQQRHRPASVRRGRSNGP